ncbi:hypothetical protein ACIA5C_12680 [Actinoplanes sp. NPDC051343]|uniref:hypothetical protein n=1 Tax=Actinoplanes sp. NPDC051343 TaxID=3363906 RepID=UPI0037B190AE
MTGIVALLCLGAGTTTFFVVNHLSEPQPSTGRPVALPTADPAETPADAPTDPATEPSDSDVVHTGDLKGFMMGAPEGARKWPGVKAAETLTDTTAAAELAGLGMGAPGDLGEFNLDDVDFTDGYVRRWIDKHGAYVTIRIYRFDHPGGGVKFATTKAGATDGGIWGSARRNIKGDRNAASFVQPKIKNGLQQVLVIGASSDIAILVTTKQRPPAATTTTTTVAKSVYSTERQKL